jgi:pimeloyl-ACP methyl ester carboxylesterase
MKPSESIFLDIRGLRYHVRSWGPRHAPKLVLLHGWMDVSASFQFLVDALRSDWHVLAPDWRGFGLTDWTRSDSYWYPDYFADLDCMLAHFQADEPVNLVGHSMGGNVACMYAGIRPHRVARLVNMEGLGIRDNKPEEAPARYAKWLDQLRQKRTLRDYASFEELALRLRERNPRLSEARSLFLARHWGGQNDDGRIALRGDPLHRIVNPTLYRAEEAMACLRRTTAPVLWVAGAHSELPGLSRMTPRELEQRKSCIARLSEAVVADAGHMVHHDQPEQLAAIIEAFLQRPL